MEPASALGTGYGESKWIGEHMLLRVAEQTDVPIQIVRLAQICGDQDGYWNEDEWFPCMVKSAFLTRCLPDIDGVRSILHLLRSRRLIFTPQRPAHVGHSTGCGLCPQLPWRARPH